MSERVTNAQARILADGDYEPVVQIGIGTTINIAHLAADLLAARAEIARLQTQLMTCNLAADGSSETDDDPAVQVAKRVGDLIVERDSLRAKLAAVCEAAKVMRNAIVAMRHYEDSTKGDYSRWDEFYDALYASSRAFDAAVKGLEGE